MPSLFAQKPSCNKPNQVKLMDPTILKVKPSLRETDIGNAGVVVRATLAKKRQKIVETERYKVSENQSLPHCT